MPMKAARMHCAVQRNWVVPAVKLLLMSAGRACWA